MRITRYISLLLALPGMTAEAQPPIAFPGAEGFGKYTTGGRGGKVYIVSNLEDSGPGSFREAAEARGPRYILFAVSGTIHLQAPVTIKGDATLAGQTAPGDGICFADHTVGLGGDNIIVRFLRFRLGDRYQNKGKVPGGGHDDAFGGNRRSHIIVDHCSMSWSTDEVFSFYGGDSSTLQWNIISEPLNYSYHFEEGDTDFENHGYGGIWGGRHLSAHHNLFAHCLSRTPRFQGIRYREESELVDFRNNVIYNWGHNNVHGGEGGRYNLVNNYYRYGPSTADKVRYRIVNPSSSGASGPGYGRFFVDGNYVDGSFEASADNRVGVHLTAGEGSSLRDEVLVRQPFPVVSLPAKPAKQAYTDVLNSAGALLPARDTLDARIISDVRQRSGRIIDVQGGFAHGTPYAVSQAAWPVLKNGKAPEDSDADGMPDAWEKGRGLNPMDPADATQQTLQPGYDNLEVYLHELAARTADPGAARKQSRR